MKCLFVITALLLTACGAALAQQPSAGAVHIGQGSALPKWILPSQDCSFAASGAITCLKTNNVAFGTAATKNVGTSVVSPGTTGTLEAYMPVQTEPGGTTGATYAFGCADIQKMTRRGNSGTAMTDTFPASTCQQLATSGAIIEVHNYDSTASDTITAGSGTTIGGGSTAVVGPGRQVRYVYS